MARTANPERKYWQAIALKNDIKEGTFNDRVLYQRMTYQEAATAPKKIPGKLKDGTYREVVR